MVYVVAYCAGEYYFFEVAADAYHVFHRVFMADVDHVLFDDGACIQFSCYIMAGSTDYLDAAFVCAVIRAAKNE